MATQVMGVSSAAVVDLSVYLLREIEKAQLRAQSDLVDSLDVVANAVGLS